MDGADPSVDLEDEVVARLSALAVVGVRDVHDQGGVEDAVGLVGRPGDMFPTGGSYFATVYGKGALGFEAVRREIGEEAFVAALRDYTESFRFATATPADLRASFEEASGQDLSAVWTARFESAESTSDIVVETGSVTPAP